VSRHRGKCFVNCCRSLFRKDELEQFCSIIGALGLLVIEALRKDSTSKAFLSRRFAESDFLTGMVSPVYKQVNGFVGIPDLMVYIEQK